MKCNFCNHSKHSLYIHDDVIKWKHFPRYWPFVREIPLTKASDAELWCFLWSALEPTVEQTMETLVIWNAIMIIMTSLYLTSVASNMCAIPKNPIDIVLTHWGRATHICFSKLAIIGSDNGLSPGRRQAIIWTNAGILLIGFLGTNFNEILIGIQAFSFKKMHLKLSSAKWRPFCLGLNVLTTRCREQQAGGKHALDCFTGVLVAGCSIKIWYGRGWISVDPQRNSCG